MSYFALYYRTRIDKMLEYLPLFKAIHIIGFVAWFAGVFYLARIFVYHREAFDENDQKRAILVEQYNIMQWRAYKIICNPGMMITWTFGILMILAYGMEWLALQPWMHIKLVFVLALTGYHLYNKRIIRKLESGDTVMTSYKFRLYNEIPTIILLAIVLLAVYKNTLDYISALLAVLAFGAALVIFTKVYKAIRERNSA